MKFSKTEVVGFISTWMILVGYALIKFNTINPTGLLYQGINFLGSIGIIYVSLKRKAKQPAMLNVIWALIALFAIGRLFL